MQIKGVKQIIASAVLFLIISQIINMGGAILTMSYYLDPAYFGLWSKLMMPANGPPGVEFYLTSVIFDFVTGIIFAGSYSLLMRSVPGSGAAKGINYGILLFLIAGVPFTFTTYLLFAVPASLLAFWTISTLIIYLVSGAAFSKIIAGKE